MAKKLDDPLKTLKKMRGVIGVIVGVIVSILAVATGLQKLLSVSVTEPLISRFDSRFDGMDSRFDSMDSRLDGMDSRFDGLDSRLDSMDRRFDGLDSRLASMDDRLNSMDSRFDNVHKELGVLTNKTDSLIARHDTIYTSAYVTRVASPRAVTPAGRELAEAVNAQSIIQKYARHIKIKDNLSPAQIEEEAIEFVFEKLWKKLLTAEEKSIVRDVAYQKGTWRSAILAVITIMIRDQVIMDRGL